MPCLFAFGHSHLAPPPSEEQCREDRIAAELSKQRIQHLSRLAGSSFEDPVRSSCKGRGCLAFSFICVCFLLQPCDEGSVRVQVVGELGECEGVGGGGAR